MLLSILLTCGVALGVGVFAVVLASISAERRARRFLYGALGLGDDLISVLMARKGSVSAQLALVRQDALSNRARLEDLRRAEGRRGRDARFD
jgi:hypothetical protein